MTLVEIVKELKANDRAAWPFARQSDKTVGFWSVNSDEIFQFHEPGSDPKEIAFSVDDVTAGDWQFINQPASDRGYAAYMALKDSAPLMEVDD